MSIRTISPATLNEWVDRLLDKQHTIYGIQEICDGARYGFEKLDRAADLRLDYDVALTPPKKFFQPACEAIVTFNGEGEYSSAADDSPFILFGVHPYDLTAINQMDDVHSADNYDVHYMRRRRNSTIVAVDVQRPSPNVFAGCMNTATVDDGFDVLLTLIGTDSYVVEAGTEKGEELMNELPRSGKVNDCILARRQQVWTDASRFLRKHELNCPPEHLPELLENAQDHPVWGKKAELCYSCGSCVLVCPTCYCFDVQDDVDWNLESGRRVRKWDGCMLEQFATVAGDHNFRPRRADRLQHRLYRKGKYLHDRFGHIACVGCGRCITACTTRIANPVEIYNTLLEDLE